MIKLDVNNVLLKAIPRQTDKILQQRPDDNPSHVNNHLLLVLTGYRRTMSETEIIGYF